MEKYIVKKKETKSTKETLKILKSNKFIVKKNKSVEFHVGKHVYRKGATKLLRGAFYSNYQRPLKIRSKGGSSRTLGTYFHMHVFHHFTCNKKKCYCIEQFNRKKRTRALVKGSKSHKRIINLEKSLKRLGLKIILCEPVVAWHKIGRATCLDALAVSVTNPNDFYVLEFKTGYSTQIRKKASTKNPLIDKKNMLGIVGKTIPNSPFNQHQLQVSFGIECFNKTSHRGCKIKDGLLIYFDSNTCRCKIEKFSNWKFSKNVSKINSQIVKYCEIYN